MCGIIGYIGNKNIKQVLIDGLEKLEYRGYDSAGIALYNNKEVKVVRSVGKVANLEEKIKKVELKDATCGIAHTRWATNGEATINNAHPHSVGKVTLVHNGIIENADILKGELETYGYEFLSDTDTEVMAALIDYYLKDNDSIKAIENATKRVTGSYALGIVIKGDDKLYATRKDSPLIIGIGNNENFIASDIGAISAYTKKYILLDTGEMAVIGKNNIVVYNSFGKKIEKEINVTELDNVQNSKLGYEHYMLKEIMEEPVVIKNLVKKYIDNLEELDISKYKQVHIVACGSAMYAGMVGKTLLEEYTNISTTVEVASEYRYKRNIYDRKTLVILISQSGETADTIAAMRIAKSNKVDTLGIVNTENSTISREVDKVLYINAGSEIAVATTKAYMLQVTLMSLIALATAKKKGLIDGDLFVDILKDFNNLPKYIKEVIDKRDSYKSIALELYKNEDIFFIGRKIDYAISLEGSLKLKEISYIHSEAYQAGELKHGTISLIEKDMPVIAIITDKELKDKTISNIKECVARGAKIVLVTTKSLDFSSDYLKIVERTVNDFVQVLLVVPALQLLAYEIAKLRECDIDKPRNLAKSVTVE